MLAAAHGVLLCAFVLQPDSAGLVNELASRKFLVEDLRRGSLCSHLELEQQRLLVAKTH